MPKKLEVSTHFSSFLWLKCDHKIRLMQVLQAKSNINELGVGNDTKLSYSSSK